MGILLDLNVALCVKCVASKQMSRVAIFKYFHPYMLEKYFLKYS